MARRLRDKNIETREARAKLKASPNPYWRAIGRGLHLGYRKSKTTSVWVVRKFVGDRPNTTYKYDVRTIAQADDREDANDDTILDFWTAQEIARGERQPEAARRRAGAYTVGDAVRDYLEHSEGRPSGRDLSHTFKTHVLPTFGDTPVADLTADAIRKWHKGIAGTPARARTAIGSKQNYRDLDDPEAIRRRQSSANLCLVKLRAALNHAWREGKVELGDWQRVQPFRGVNVARARFLTLAESKRLINASEGDFRDLVRAALLTGCRYQELARLRVSDFNPDNGSLHIRKSKSGKDRHVILTDEGAEFFSQLTAGRDGEDLILRREWKPGDQDYPFRQACARAGIKGASFHTLRHTWASLAVMAGVPLIVVAKCLGHANTGWLTFITVIWPTTSSRKPSVSMRRDTASKSHPA